MLERILLVLEITVPVFAVISTTTGVAEDESSALVVWTTLLSVVVIPVWTFFLIQM